MAHWGHHNQVPSRQMQVKCLPYLHQIGKHQDGLCQHCNKPDTITHFLTECRHSATCLAVLADCRKLNLTPTLYIVLSDSRLHSAIVSSLNRTIWYWLVLLFSLLTTKSNPLDVGLHWAILHKVWTAKKPSPKIVSCVHTNSFLLEVGCYAVADHQSYVKRR